MSMPKDIELHTLNGRVAWYVNYIPRKIFFVVVLLSLLFNENTEKQEATWQGGK